MQRTSSNKSKSVIEIVMFVAAILCTIAVIVDIIRMDFTPFKILLDILIVVIDVRYIVLFIRNHRQN